jgi:hypothetical protein
LAEAGNTWFGPKANKTWLGNSRKYKWRPHVDGRPLAALQHMVIQYVVSACIFCFCPAMFFQLLAQSMYFQLLPSHVFSAFVFVPGFLTVAIMEVDKQIRISERMTFSTFHKRRAL